MHKVEVELEAAEFSARLETLIDRFGDALQRYEPEGAAGAISSLQSQIGKHRDRGYLTVAFVGQYSAGKSTTISALTGRRDIKIDTDIATAEVSEYKWRGILLVDTPGLYTERQEHDAIAYRALNESDLLVYTLTHALFDSVTARDFHRLAFEKGYQRKMFLLVNKVNNEAGEIEARIEQYRQSIQKALVPHSLADFPVAFIDARDYIDGLDQEDEGLVSESRFPTFVESLNQFARERQTLRHIDTPARILLNHVEQAESRLRRRDGQDDAYVEQLTQLGRSSRLRRERLRSQVRELCLRLVSAVSEEGTLLASQLGDKLDIGALVQASQVKIDARCKDVGEEMASDIKRSIADLANDFREVLNGSLAEQFASPLAERSVEVSARPVSEGCEDLDRLRQQVKRLADIAQSVGLQVTDMAIGRAGGSAGTFLKASEVAGSQLHSIVLKVGHLVGTKFRPWEAVNIATKLAKFAKWLGPIAAAITVGTEIYAAKKEGDRALEAARARIDVQAQYGVVASDLEQSFLNQLGQVEKESFDVIDANIEKARREHESAIVAGSNAAAELSAIRRDAQDLLRQLA